MILQLTALLILTNVVLSQNPSPCPEIFSYEPRAESDRWYGNIALSTAEDLTGVWLHIHLDRQAELLGNWFGESSSTDNIEFTIRNSKYKLEAGPPVSVRFFVKYNAAKTVPSVKTIRLNGRTICGRGESETIVQPTLHISKLKPTPPSYSNEDSRPSSSNNGDSRPSSSDNGNRPSSSNNGDSRPSSSDNGNRPSSSNNGDNRPSSSNNGGSRPSDNGNRPSRPSNNNSNTGSRPSSNSRPSSRPSSNRGNSNNELKSKSHKGSDSNGGKDSNFGGNSNSNRPSSSNSGGGSLLFGNTDDSEGDLDFFPGDFANIQRPSQNRPSIRPSQSSNRSPTCGVVASRASPLIAHGQDTSPGQWPWHAALYHSKGVQLMYTCGATLITQQHVLTAAHCVTKPQSNTVVNPGNILIYLGKHNLVTFGPEVQDRDVSNIYIHPEYNHSVYFNDVAVLKLSRPVELTNFVRPCCLWDEDTDIDNMIDRQGTVVGWGFDSDRKLSNKLMQAQMPIVSTVKCIYSNRDFFSRFTFEKNYCAGFRNGTSVCNGDSGGGMVFAKKGTSGQNTVWQIRGLVSVGVALQGQGICDTSQYIVFTDVAKHTHWIRQVLS